MSYALFDQYNVKDYVFSVPVFCTSIWIPKKILSWESLSVNLTKVGGFPQFPSPSWNWLPQYKDSLMKDSWQIGKTP